MSDKCLVKLKQYIMALICLAIVGIIIVWLVGYNNKEIEYVEYTCTLNPSNGTISNCTGKDYKDAYCYY